MFDEATLKQFDAWGVDRPTIEKLDVSPDEIRSRLTPVKATNWRMEGNELIADTDQGQLRQRIPTNVICLGTGKDGLPIFKEIG